MSHTGTTSHNGSSPLPRVCVVSQLYNPFIGGLPRQAVLLTERLHREGVESFVIARKLSGVPPAVRSDGIEVVEIPTPFPGVHVLDRLSIRNLLIPIVFSLQCIGHLVRRRNRYDLAHFHGGGIMLWMCLPFLRLLRKKTVVKIASVQGTEFGSLAGRYLGLGNLLARASRNVDAFVGISEEIREGLRREGVSGERIHPIPNFVDTGIFRPPGVGEKERMKERLGYAGRLLVVYSGHLSPIKRVDVLLAAWSTVSREFPEARLLILGDGPLRTELEETALNGGIADSVRFAGRMNDVEDCLRAADAFVLSSRMEGLPNSLLEAMATGLPVVATCVGGVPDVVRDGENGLLAVPEDPSSLARGIRALLGDESLRNRLGTAAADTILGVFSLDSVMKRYLDLYGRMFREGGWNSSARPSPRGPGERAGC